LPERTGASLFARHKEKSSAMQYKIGVYGSNITEGEHAVQRAQELGIALAQQQVIVVTGGCSGMPYTTAYAAKQSGAEVWGFTPARNEEEQRRTYPHDDITIYDRLFYIPEHYDQHFYLQQPLSAEHEWSARLKYRNVISTIHVDAGIIVAGGWGTLNEVTNLLYDGKPIGVLTGSGALADELPHWFPRLRKKSASTLYFEHQPTTLVSLILDALIK